MDAKATTKKTVSALSKYGAGAVGIGGAMFGLGKLNALIPSTFPTFVKNLGPGVAVMLISLFFSEKVTDERAKSLLLGLGIGGFIDAIRKTLGSKIAFINSATPALSGLAGQSTYRAINNGDYPVSYYEKNSFQGLGDAYALSGMSMQGLGTPYALNGMSMQGPYALN